jgi:hypothetical protein
VVQHLDGCNYDVLEDQKALSQILGECL